MPAGPRRRRDIAKACLLFVSGGILASAQAGEIWNGASLIDNKWTTAENWMPFGPPANDGSANIMMVGPGRADSLVDVPWSIQSLQFPAGAVGFSITGSTLSIGAGGIGNFSAVSQSIANNITLTAAQTLGIESDLNVSGALGGSFGLIKTGNGTLTLSGATANTYTGATTINAGTLLLNKSVANGTIIGPLIIGDGVGSDVVRWMAGEQLWHGAGSAVTINSSGLMDLNGSSETIRDLNLNQGKVASGAGTLSVMGTINSTGGVDPSIISDRLSLGSGTRMINVADGAADNDLVIEASVVNGGFIKSGPGTLLMIGSPNTYSGTTTVLGGVLALAKSGADGAVRGDLVIGDGSAALAAVLLGANEQIHAVGNIVSIHSNGALALGGFTETVGDLEMSGGQISGGTLTVLGEVNVVPAAATAQISASVNLGGIIRNFNIADGAPAVDLAISGSVVNGGFLKSGPGTLMLGGASVNTHAGSTTVNQGVLLLGKSTPDAAINGNLTIGGGIVRLGANEQIKANGWNWISVNGSGRLELDGHLETISNLALTGGNVTTGPSSAGVLRVMGDVMSNPSGMTSTIAGRLDLGGGTRTFNVAEGMAAIDLSVTAVISNGGINKIGDGKMRLLGNLYSGGTTLTAGTLVLASDFAAGTAAITLEGGMLEAEGAPALNNPIVIGGAAAVVGGANLRFSGPITSSNVLSKRGGGTLTMAGPQNNQPGAGLNVVSGRVNLNSNAGTPAAAGSAAKANLVLEIVGGEMAPSLVVLAANQELAGLEVAAGGFSDVQGLDLNSPVDPGAFRTVRVYAPDLEVAKSSIHAAVANANATGAANPQDGIFDSGLPAHPGAKIGVGIVNDAHGDASILIRPTMPGDLNLDGVVSISDFIDLASHFDEAGVTWQEGDLNYDKFVTISDFIDLAANFNLSYGPSAVIPAEAQATSVPEPNTIAFFIVSAGLAARRRHGRDARATG